MKTIRAMLTALAVLALLAFPALAQEDQDCPDFPSQAAAQEYFEDKGGSPANNVDGLDRDNDGVACENETGYANRARDETPAGEDGDENGATVNGEDGDDGEDNGDGEVTGAEGDDTDAEGDDTDAETSGDMPDDQQHADDGQDDAADDQQDMPEEMPDTGAGALSAGSGLPWGALAAAVSLALASRYGVWRRG